MRVRNAVVAAAMMIGLSAPLGAAGAETISGELITIMCFEGHGEKGRGEGHTACAVKCAKDGYPLAVLTADGTLYKVVGSLAADHNVKLQELLTRPVVATGTVGSDDDGKTLDATSVEPAKK